MDSLYEALTAACKSYEEAVKETWFETFDWQEALTAAVGRLEDAARSFFEVLEGSLKAAVDSISGFCSSICDLVGEVIENIYLDIQRERSREASRRRPEPYASKPRPPFRKRMKIFRCRNSC